MEQQTPFTQQDLARDKQNQQGDDGQSIDYTDLNSFKSSAISKSSFVVVFLCLLACLGIVSFLCIGYLAIPLEKEKAAWEQTKDERIVCLDSRMKAEEDKRLTILAKEEETKRQAIKALDDETTKKRDELSKTVATLD